MAPTPLRWYTSNMVYEKLSLLSAAMPTWRPRRSDRAMLRSETHTTEEAAKRAAARAYRPAVVRLPNGRYACLQAGDAVPRGAVPRGAHAVSRWGANGWRAYE